MKFKVNLVQLVTTESNDRPLISDLTCWYYRFFNRLSFLRNTFPTFPTPDRSSIRQFFFYLKTEQFWPEKPKFWPFFNLKTGKFRPEKPKTKIWTKIDRKTKILTIFCLINGKFRPGKPKITILTGITKILTIILTENWKISTRKTKILTIFLSENSIYRVLRCL